MRAAALCGALLAGSTATVALAAPGGPAAAAPAPSPLQWSAPSYLNLGGVACAGAGFCMGLSPYQDRHFYAVLDGSGWSETPLPASAPAGALACTTPTFCVMGGGTGIVGSAVVSAVEFYNGSTWSAPTTVGTPLPIAPETYSGFSLRSLSCPTTSFCMGVADVISSTSFRYMAAVTYNGSTWSAPTFVGLDAVNGQVSCTSPTFCLTMDLHGDSYVYNGLFWSPVPVGNGFTQMQDMECASATLCTAIGYYQPAGTTGPPELEGVTAFDGTSWSAPIADPSVPDGVTCPSTSECDVFNSGGDVQSFDGTTLSAAVPIGSFPSGTNVWLTCPATTYCVASLGSPSLPDEYPVEVGTAGTPAPRPTVASVTPPSGPSSGGTTVTVRGTGFAPTSVVMVRESSWTSGSGQPMWLLATDVTVVDSTTLTAVLPAPVGPYAANSTDDVEVTTAGGTSADTPTDQFAYGTGVPTPIGAAGGLLLAVLLGGGLTVVVARRSRRRATAPLKEVAG